MVVLTRLIGAFVGWVTASPRRIVGAIVVPFAIVFLLVVPRDDPADTAAPADRPGPVLDSSTRPDQTGTGTGTGGDPTSADPTSVGPSSPEPTTVTIGPGDEPRIAPELPDGAGQVAREYVTTTGSHDARDGGDTDYADSYQRAESLVTPEVFADFERADQAGDQQWTEWRADQATVEVRVDRVAVPDGAPAPTDDTAYARVRFTQVVTPSTGDGTATEIPGEITMIVTRQADGRWLVSDLLAV